MRWHSFPANFTTKKPSSTYITRSKEKKRKIVGEENDPDPVFRHYFVLCQRYGYIHGLYSFIDQLLGNTIDCSVLNV